MRFSIFAVTVTPLIATALALPAALIENSNSDPHSTSAPSQLPACGPTPGPCSCPAGTFYKSSTTHAIIPASASDLQAVIGDFLSTAWFGTSPVAVVGTGTIPGAKRTLSGGIPGAGVYPFVEQLTKYTAYPGKSGFYQKFQMVDTPFLFTMNDGTPGILAGTWDLMDVHAVGSKSTSWLWNIYACFSLDFDFQAFHESGMKNATAILKSQGKTNGDIIGPFSY